MPLQHVWEVTRPYSIIYDTTNLQSSDMNANEEIYDLSISCSEVGAWTCEDAYLRDSQTRATNTLAHVRAEHLQQYRHHHLDLPTNPLYGASRSVPGSAIHIMRQTIGSTRHCELP